MRSLRHSACLPSWWDLNANPCLSSSSSVQFSSVAQPCLTLCNPMNHSTPGLPIHHQLLESTQTHVHWVSDAIQPSHHQLLKYFSWASWNHAGTWLSLVWRVWSFHLCLLPLQDFFLGFRSFQSRFSHSSKTTTFCLSFVPSSAVLNQKCPQRKARVSVQCCAHMFASLLQGSCASFPYSLGPFPGPSDSFSSPALPEFVILIGLRAKAI